MSDGTLDFSFLKWAFPVSVLVESDTLWLVAGEDVRYALSAKNTEALAGLLRSCAVPGSLGAMLAQASPPQREEWEQILRQLYSERVLVECRPVDLSCLPTSGIFIVGNNPLADKLRDLQTDKQVEADIRVLCQQTLDYAQALEFNRQALVEKFRWIWATTGPSDRAYLGPLFHPRTGPCLDCLFYHFRQLSPAPEWYDVLRVQRPEGSFATSSFPEVGLDVLASLCRWKLTLVGSRPPSQALYSLHVLERATLETSMHQVFRNPECPSCQTNR